MYIKPNFGWLIPLILSVLVFAVAVSSLSDVMILLSGYMSVCILLMTGIITYILYVGLIAPKICPTCKTTDDMLEPPVDLSEIRERMKIENNQ